MTELFMSAYVYMVMLEFEYNSSMRIYRPLEQRYTVCLQKIIGATLKHGVT